MKKKLFKRINAHHFISPTIFIALAFIAILTSCHKEDCQDDSVLDVIAEYRTFYEEQMHDSGTKSFSNIPQKSPQWGKATIQNWHRGRAAVIPLDYHRNTSSLSPQAPTP